jgi:hypothetical protein
MPVRYTLGRMSDAQVLRLMDDLMSRYKVASASVSVGDLASFNLSLNEDDGLIESEREPFRNLLTDDTYFITSMNWQASSSAHSVTYHRQKVWGQNIHQQQTWIDAPSPFIDSVEVKAKETNAPSLLAVVARHVVMAPPIVGGPEAGTAMDQSQAILNRVSAAIATLVEHTAERQKELDHTRSTLSREAEKAVKAIRGEADAKVKAIEQDFDDRRQELADREAELDDRANTHVRREFAKQMAGLSDTQLKENLLTKSRTSFWVPLVICVVPILILAYVVSSELGFIGTFADSIGKIAVDGKLTAEQKTFLIGNVNYQILYAQMRIVLQSLGIAALVWFALRLASSRYSLASGWERDLHRFRLDTERAGFLVEGDLEARKVNQEGLPDVLLESFSRNLFASSDGGHGPSSSEGLGGALNALLGQAAKVRVGPDGVNVEIEGKGIRKARKLIEEE